ncbi:condensation domain-containing protein, partial [Xanthomonas maliensis]|uniref:condensation domain-containing protein n=2 Tax=Xanthomonas maliensis TaxID=1321368 RepID=UPI00126484E2
MDRPFKTLPASFAQQRLWFLARLDPRGSTAYHLAAGACLRGALDVEALQSALVQVVERHEVLRTCLLEVQGQVRQRILDTATFDLQRTDLRDHPHRAAQVDSYARGEASRPFDLAAGPLIRGHLLRLHQDEHVLLITMHHLVSDGWSIGIFLAELGALYTAARSGCPASLPPLRVQYADYAIWQHKRLSSEVVQRQLAYWRSRLAGAPALLQLPLDRPRPKVQDYAGASIDFKLPDSTAHAARQLARSQRCTLFTVLLASWSLLLSRLSGAPEVVIGTAVAGRTRSEVEPLIGLFVNTLALRVAVPEQATVADWLRQVRDTVLGAQDHQDVPFEQVVEALKPARTLAHPPIHQVMFSLDTQQQAQVLTLPELEITPLPAGQHSAEFDLALSLHQYGDSVGGRLVYATALFDADSMQRHVAQFLSLLQAIGNDADVRIADLPWLPQTQRQQLLQDFNATIADLPPAATLVQALHAQVQRTPQATALIDGEHHLRYAQLWERASTLAAQLQQRGLAHGQALALILPRSAGLVVAQL